MSMIGLSDLEQDLSRQGLIHLYVGDGKGKTTAAIGLAARFLGHGGKVLFCQFLKGRDTGELTSLTTLGAELLRAKCGDRFFFQLSPEEQQTLCRDHRSCLLSAGEKAATGRYGLVVMDEVVDAVNLGAIQLAALLELLHGRHPSVEVVLTGRNPPRELIDIADYHTDFVCRKHPYQAGIASRSGVEF